MKTSFLSRFIILATVSIAALSCKDSKPQFAIEGKISDADTTMLYLERRSITETKIIDSLKLDKDGTFKFEEPSLGYAEFYLLRLNGQSINLVVDSTETITVNAPRATFARDYTIEGSSSSIKLKDVVLTQNKLSQDLTSLKKQFDNKGITQEQYISSVQDAVNEYKENARQLIFSDYKSLAAYFALFQKVDGYLIFDPYDKKDLNVFQAVATVWDQFKSESPRAAQLKSFTLNAIAEVRQMAVQEENLKRLETTELTDYTTYYDITLPNMQNKNISLSSLRGKVVILDFTVYQTEFSPAHNVLIHDVYNKFKGNVDVYQVSFDSDSHAWQNSAVNLPWTCVRDERSLGSELIRKYNLEGFPTIFLINKNGEIVKRISAKDNLSSEVQKLL
ncbi:MAG: thioredoxin-like domain-containing protein [Dysgonomonas sp.]